MFRIDLAPEDLERPVEQAPEALNNRLTAEVREGKRDKIPYDDDVVRGMKKAERRERRKKLQKGQTRTRIAATARSSPACRG